MVFAKLGINETNVTEGHFNF